MANSKSAIKYIRKTETRTTRNRQIKSQLKTLGRKVELAKESGDAAVLQSASRDYLSALEKASGKGIVHKNKVARHKSRHAAVLAATAS